ncbi:MAG TPA: hypothetical protein PLX89_06900 [Verrucomicrobiota bacterium]|nr:hypothetical protein [Verrucomicrobiales bacterium]HRI12719.1 hypothetical protein [Verrucomicrobiota bacterium]
MKRASLLRFLSLVALAAGLAGCQSSPTGAGTGKYAAVEISGFSRSAVEMATEQVFVKEGYKLAATGNQTLVFERPASTTQNVVWGGWQTGLWDRVVAKITRLGSDDDFLLSADAYRVQSKDDSILEKESKMGFAVQSKYQEMLEKVKKLLEPMPKSPGIGEEAK